MEDKESDISQNTLESSERVSQVLSMMAALIDDAIWLNNHFFKNSSIINFGRNIHWRSG